jgi:pimeloyl-ACP methyl ester carboxylesterase
MFTEAARDWGRDFRVVAPPMSGWEGTPAATRDEYLPSALARRAEWIAGEERFFVVGFSWGGTIGLRIDSRRLLGLVLVDVGYENYPGDQKTYEELLTEYAAADFAPPEAAAAGMWGVGVEPAADALDSVAAVPVLLLVATQPLVDRRAEDLARFRSVLSDAEVHVIEGAEHNVLETAPGTAIPLVGKWLRPVAGVG